ncbi:MAG: hypothetical protein ACFBSE_12035 [Prochloraceae cyanobacterium]
MFSKKLVAIFLALTLCWTTAACSSGTSTTSSEQTTTNTTNNSVSATPEPTKIEDGKYPVQQASYNDVNGEYSLMLLNANPPIYRNTELQMARLTDEEIENGAESYLKVENGTPSFHLSKDFQIEYVHNVTEVQTNPQTGQQETVIVRQESNFWVPFAASFAGSALASMLFTPQYYMPPAYGPGPMNGYGGYGTSYNQAVDSYQQRYGEPPTTVKNRNNLRTTGAIRNASSTTRRNTVDRNKSTGSGFGASNLNSNDRSNSTVDRKPSFGSGTKRRSGFGSRRR